VRRWEEGAGECLLGVVAVRVEQSGDYFEAKSDNHFGRW